MCSDNFRKIHKKTLRWSLVLNEVADLQRLTLFKTRLRYRCFLVNFFYLMKQQHFFWYPTLTRITFFAEAVTRFKNCFKSFGISKEFTVRNLYPNHNFFRRVAQVNRSIDNRLLSSSRKSVKYILKMSWRRVNKNILIWFYILKTSFKTSWKCIGKTSWSRLQDVFVRPLEDVLVKRMTKTNIFVLIKTSGRRMTKANILVLIKAPSRRFLKTKDLFKTSSPGRKFAGMVHHCGKFYQATWRIVIVWKTNFVYEKRLDRWQCKT